MDEKRSWQRVAVNKPGGLVVEGGLNPIPCTVEDISAGGMRISLGKYLFPEVFSNISVSFADNFSLDLGANVAWQESVEGRNTYGLRFNRIDESSRDRLSQYVGSSLSEEGKRNWWKGP